MHLFARHLERACRGGPGEPVQLHPAQLASRERVGRFGKLAAHLVVVIPRVRRNNRRTLKRRPGDR